jgi:hypothetical protein
MRDKVGSIQQNGIRLSTRPITVRSSHYTATMSNSIHSRARRALNDAAQHLLLNNAVAIHGFSAHVVVFDIS